jgi:hypothetical protein
MATMPSVVPPAERLNVLPEVVSFVLSDLDELAVHGLDPALTEAEIGRLWVLVDGLREAARNLLSEADTIEAAVRENVANADSVFSDSLRAAMVEGFEEKRASAAGEAS